MSSEEKKKASDKAKDIATYKAVVDAHFADAEAELAAKRAAKVAALTADSTKPQTAEGISVGQAQAELEKLIEQQTASKRQLATSQQELARATN